jgi:hypothetical protein
MLSIVLLIGFIGMGLFLLHHFESKKIFQKFQCENFNSIEKSPLSQNKGRNDSFAMQIVDEFKKLNGQKGFS